MIGDYYVSIDFEPEVRSVLAVYAPDNKMALLRGNQVAILYQ